MKDGDLPVSVGATRVTHETAKAILVKIDGVGSTWIPKSAVHDDSEVWSVKNGEGELVVKAWFARAEGWE